MGGDNYWNDQGSGGVHGTGGAYADSGQSNEPKWAQDEPNYNDPKYNNDDWQKDDPVQIKTDPPKKASNTTKKSKWGRKSKNDDDDVTIRKRECCSERLRKYLGLWLCFALAIAIGIIVMAEVSLNIGIIVFLIGFIGMICSSYCFRKCG